jgi:hypothetical protein
MDIITLLLHNYGLDLKTPTGNWGLTAIRCARTSPYPEVLTALLKAGGNIFLGRISILTVHTMIIPSVLSEGAQTVTNLDSERPISISPISRSCD